MFYREAWVDKCYVLVLSCSYCFNCRVLGVNMGKVGWETMFLKRLMSISVSQPFHGMR